MVAIAFSAVHVLPYDPLNILTSTGFLIAVCWLTNRVFGRIWNVPTNAESSLLTALILALIAIVAIVALLFLGSQVSKILSTVGSSV